MAKPPPYDQVTDATIPKTATESLDVDVATTTTTPSHNPETTTATQRIGKQGVPIVIVDNLLPQSIFHSLQQKLKIRTAYVNSGGDPNIRVPLDIAIINPILDSISENKEMNNLYPRETFNKKKYIHGYASISCKFSAAFIPSDALNQTVNSSQLVATLFLDDGGDDDEVGKMLKSKDEKTKHGFTFYREIVSGLERISDGDLNETEFCNSFPTSFRCKNDARSTFKNINNQFEEIHHVAGVANRLVVYPADMIVSDWVKDHQSHSNDAGDSSDSIYCSPEKGGLLVLLYFSWNKKSKVHSKVQLHHGELNNTGGGVNINETTIVEDLRVFDGRRRLDSGLVWGTTAASNLDQNTGDGYTYFGGFVAISSEFAIVGAFGAKKASIFRSSNMVATYGPIENWDMSEVTDMSYLFENKTSFNPDVSKWVVSSVTTMESSTYHN